MFSNIVTSSVAVIAEQFGRVFIWILMVFSGTFTQIRSMHWRRATIFSWGSLWVTGGLRSSCVKKTGWLISSGCTVYGAKKAWKCLESSIRSVAVVKRGKTVFTLEKELGDPLGHTVCDKHTPEPPKRAYNRGRFCFLMWNHNIFQKNSKIYPYILNYPY